MKGCLSCIVCESGEECRGRRAISAIFGAHQLLPTPTLDLSTCAMAPSAAAAANKPDKSNRHKSLASLLRFFEDTELTVETKTGKFYKGTLSSSDEAMNLQLDDCCVRNQPTLLAHVHIRGSTIRYIHFPDHTDLSGVIRGGIDKEKAATNKYKRGLRKK